MKTQSLTWTPPRSRLFRTTTLIILSAAATVALSDVPLDPPVLRAWVLNSGGQHLSSLPLISEVSLGEGLVHPLQLTGGGLVMSPGYIPKKQLIHSLGALVPVGDPGAAPLVTRLEGNYPNPFNPSTTISFSLAEAGAVSLQIFDPAGRLVRSLVDGGLPEGEHEVRWDGRSENGTAVSSGVYFARFAAGRHREQRKLVMLK